MVFHCSGDHLVDYGAEAKFFFEDNYGDTMATLIFSNCLICRYIAGFKKENHQNQQTYLSQSTFGGAVLDWQILQLVEEARNKHNNYGGVAFVAKKERKRVLP